MSDVVPAQVPINSEAPFQLPFGKTRSQYLRIFATSTMDLMVTTMRTHGVLAMSCGLQDGIIGYPEDGLLPFDAYVFSDLHKAVCRLVQSLLPFMRQSNVDHLFMLVDELARLDVDLNGSMDLLSTAKAFIDCLRVPSKTLALGPVESCISTIKANHAMRSAELFNQAVEIHEKFVADAHEYVRKEVDKAIDKASNRFLSVRQAEELTEEEGELPAGPTISTVIVKTPDRATHSSRSREAAIDKRNRKRQKHTQVKVENGKEEMPPPPVPFPDLDSEKVVLVE